MGGSSAVELGPVFRLVYRSRSRISDDRRRADHDAIFGVACAKNAGLGVTGALLAWRDVFVQVLEGDEAVVRALYATIEADHRHEHVTLLDADTVPDRVFGGWSMARVGGADDVDADIPVLVDRIVEDPDAPRPTVPRQDTMLELMCEYARVGAG